MYFVSLTLFRALAPAPDRMASIIASRVCSGFPADTSATRGGAAAGGGGGGGAALTGGAGAGGGEVWEGADVWIWETLSSDSEALKWSSSLAASDLVWDKNTGTVRPRNQAFKDVYCHMQINTRCTVRHVVKLHLFLSL